MTSLFFISLMNGASWGGSEELWYKTALHALKQGRKVGCAVYDWAAKEEKLKHLETAGAKIYRLPNRGVERKTRLQKIQFRITKKISLRAAIGKLPFHQYDLTIFNLGEFENTHTAWKNVFKKAGQYIVLYHNYKEGQVLKPKKAAILQSWMDHSQLNLFASRRIIEVLKDHSHIQTRNSGILLNPVNLEPPAQAITYPPLFEGNYILIMLAALEVDRKAQDNLVIALSSNKWRERNWMLYLFGEGKDRQTLIDLVARNNIADKIFLKGHTKDPSAELKDSHLLLQMTHIDAMPLSVVEAMAIGRPAVVSRIGDMPDWIIDGQNGWISENASVNEIDSTLERAWQQRDAWSAFGMRARETFQVKFPSSVEEKLLEQVDAAVNK